jgi:hypothetical protein
VRGRMGRRTYILLVSLINDVKHLHGTRIRRCQRPRSTVPVRDPIDFVAAAGEVMRGIMPPAEILTVA